MTIWCFHHGKGDVRGAEETGKLTHETLSWV